MKATLLRTGSNPTHIIDGSRPGSPFPSSPRVVLSFQGRNENGFITSIRRSSSDTDMIRSERTRVNVSRVGSGSVSVSDMGMIVEEELLISGNNWGGKGNYNNNNKFFGGGNNNDQSNNNNNNDSEKGRIKEYYLELLKSNPCDSLILRNYGKYMHEVEKNTKKAEEYYGRAILANPRDGELLCLYANLIWESQNDVQRAHSYFHQALHASPSDSTVLGSYAHFLWKTEDEEEEEDNEGIRQANADVSTMAAAYQTM